MENKERAILVSLSEKSDLSEDDLRQKIEVIAKENNICFEYLHGIGSIILRGTLDNIGRSIELLQAISGVEIFENSKVYTC